MFNKTVDYSTYDVTKLVRAGSDSLAVSLGNGFYAGGADDYPSSGEPWQAAVPTLKLELQVWYADGTSTQVLSDDSWKVTTGPTTENSPAAETYDAQLAKPGWNQPGYNDSSWASAAVAASGEHDPVVLRDVELADRGLALEHRQRGHHHRQRGHHLPAQGPSPSPTRPPSPAPSCASTATTARRPSSTGPRSPARPATANNGWQTSQVADVKSLLVAGTNVIAVEGLNVSANASGIIAAAQLDSTRIVTDGTWKALPGSSGSSFRGGSHRAATRLHMDWTLYRREYRRLVCSANPSYEANGFRSAGVGLVLNGRLNRANRGWSKPDGRAACVRSSAGTHVAEAFALSASGYRMCRVFWQFGASAGTDRQRADAGKRQPPDLPPTIASSIPVLAQFKKGLLDLGYNLRLDYFADGLGNPHRRRQAGRRL